MRWVITIRDTGASDVPPIIRLRRLLKVMLRLYSFRCLDVRPAGEQVVGINDANPSIHEATKSDTPMPPRADEDPKARVANVRHDRHEHVDNCKDNDIVAVRVAGAAGRQGERGSPLPSGSSSTATKMRGKSLARFSQVIVKI